MQPGSTTFATMARHGSPKDWAMRISPRGTPSTPAMVPMTVGKKTPNASVMIFEPSPMPNQMMNSGTRAILGIGKSAETTAMTGERRRVNNPAATPTTNPAAVPHDPADHQALQRGADDATTTRRWPRVPPGPGRSPTGVDRKLVENQSSEAPICHSASSATSVAAPAHGKSRGAKPRARSGICRHRLGMLDLPVGGGRIVADQLPELRLDRQQVRIGRGAMPDRPVDAR